MELYVAIDKEMSEAELKYLTYDIMTNAVKRIISWTEKTMGWNQ